jgi:hypothetical protein
MNGAEDAEPETLRVPTLSEVSGHDLSGLYDLRLRPPESIVRRAYAPGPPPPFISAEHDLDGLLERIRAEVRQKWGPDADRP